MKERKEDKLSPDILSLEKKLEHLLIECDLIAQKHTYTSKFNEYITSVQNILSGCQSMISERTEEFKGDLEKIKKDITTEVKEKVEKTITETLEEKVKDTIITHLTSTLITPVKEQTDVLDSQINTVQNGLKRLTKALDTQDKNIFERTLENTTDFINEQKNYAMQMYEQFKETGSIKSNFQQLTRSIPEAQSNAYEFCMNPSDAKFESALTSFNNTTGFFIRYLSDKYEETKTILEEGTQTIENSIEKKGSVIEYAQSLMEKADATVEQKANTVEQKISRLDTLYRFYQSTIELGEKVGRTLTGSSDDLTSNETTEEKTTSLDKKNTEVKIKP